MRSVYVFQAPEHEWDTAKAKAISIARRQENEFVNGEGKKAAWRLLAVETLDMIPTPREDGVEVYSEFAPSGEEAKDWSLATKFDPETTQSCQTGVWPWEPGEEPLADDDTPSNE